MPGLDVSSVVSDPMLADSFDIIRRSERIDANGRAVPVEIPMPGQIGVVTQQDPAELMKRDDGQFVPRSIFVASRFAFRGVSEGNQPDLIVWNGTRYEVRQVYPYSRYGRGIYEVVASSFQAIDNAQ